MSASILVIDDDEEMLALVGHTLRSHGYDVRVARDGASALAAVEQQRPDIILLDVMMPEMDGIQVLDRIRTNPCSARVPVILVTARTHDEDVLAGYKYGADYYITKPFSAPALLEGIGLVLKAYQSS